MAESMINIASAENDTAKATVGFVMASAFVASGVETVVFLSAEGVHLPSRS
jgi:uncharacterized protein